MTELETRVEERQDTREVRSWDAANRCINCDSLIYQYKQQWYHAYSGYSCCGRMAVAIPAPADVPEGEPTRTIDCHAALHGRCKRCGLTVEQWTDSVCPDVPTAAPATRDADGPRWCLACGEPTVDPYCKECTERYRAIAESRQHAHEHRWVGRGECGVDLDDTPDTLPSTPAPDEAARGRVRDKLETLCNASYTELRSVVETNREYTPEPRERFANENPDTKHFKCYATSEEWAVAERVSGWFQGQLQEVLDHFPPTEATAARVEEAAKEIRKLCDEMAPDIPNDSTSYAPTVQQIAAIISKHCTTTPAVKNDHTAEN